MEAECWYLRYQYSQHRKIHACVCKGSWKYEVIDLKSILDGCFTCKLEETGHFFGHYVHEASIVPECCAGMCKCFALHPYTLTPLFPASMSKCSKLRISMHFYKGPATKGRKHSETGCWWRLMKSWLAMCKKEHQNNEINIWKDIVFQLYNQTCVNNQTCLKRMPFPKKCDQPAPATKHCSKGQAAAALGLKDNWLKNSNMHTALKYGKIADIIQVT